jgi:hypothetical protein
MAWLHVFAVLAAGFGALLVTNRDLFASSLKASGTVGQVCTDVDAIEETNQQIYPILQDLKNTDFFKIFKVKLDGECPFWAVSLMCELATCEVCD